MRHKMKALFIAFGVCAACLGQSSGDFSNRSFLLRNGERIENFKVTSESDDAVIIRYAGGMKKVLKGDLPPELSRVYPTPGERELTAESQLIEDAAKVREALAADADAILKLCAVQNPTIFAGVKKNNTASRTIEGEKHHVKTTWSVFFNDGSGTWIIDSVKHDKPEWFVSIPAGEFNQLVLILGKFRSWSATCEANEQKPTITESLGQLGGRDCTFNFSRSTPAYVHLGNAAFVDDSDALNLLAVLSKKKELAAEALELIKARGVLGEKLR